MLICTCTKLDSFHFCRCIILLYVFHQPNNNSNSIFTFWYSMDKCRSMVDCSMGGEHKWSISIPQYHFLYKRIRYSIKKYQLIRTLILSFSSYDIVSIIRCWVLCRHIRFCEPLYFFYSDLDSKFSKCLKYSFVSVRMKFTDEIIYCS